MAEVRTDIYNALLGPVKSVREYDKEADQAEGNKFGLLLQRGQYDAQQRGVADDNAFRDAAKGFGPDAQANYQNLLSRGLPKQAAAYQESTLKGRESLGKIQGQETSNKASEFDLREKKRKTALADIAALDSPATAIQSLQAHYRAGDIDEQKYQTVLATIPQNPADFPAWQVKMLRSIMSAENQMLDERQRTAQEETTRNNKAQNATSARQASTAEGQLGVARQRLTLDQQAPKGQIVQTDQGTMVVDPRNGNAVPAMGPGGVPLTKPLKDIPANVNTAIITNAQNLNKINQAIDLLSGKDVGALKGDKAATGWKGYLPQAALNRVDPSGVDSRAMISDIGSLVLHDRSGAAVTASESPRLLPFIPLATDDPETAKKKLTRFKQLYEQEQQAFADTYGKDQGYRASPVKPTTSAAKPSGGGLSPDAIAAELKRRGH